jgi:hypothetical protein
MILERTMSFQEITPDTSVYMIAGFTVFFGMMAIYLVSLFFRWRILKRKLELLKNMEKWKNS